MKLTTFDGKPYSTATIAELNAGRLARKEGTGRLRFERAMQVASVYFVSLGTSAAILFT
jgi:hypothetical protein